jgi:hypothetical protein
LKSLACIAHKCLDISERCRLWQQDIPATPEHPAVCFLEKGFKNCLTNTLEKAAIENARPYVQDSLLALGRKFRLREQELGMEDQSFQ